MITLNSPASYHITPVSATSTERCSKSLKYSALPTHVTTSSRSSLRVQSRNLQLDSSASNTGASAQSSTHPARAIPTSHSSFQVRSQNLQCKSDSSTAHTGAGTRSSSWSARDDETLIQARAQGLNWNQISPEHFPDKSANACRKRHERLMERQNAEQWDGVKLDILAQAYMEARREMWSILAARVGEKWTLVEQKCMEKGLKNLTQAYRSAQRKLSNNGTYHNHEDSGIGITDLDEDSGIGITDLDEEPLGDRLSVFESNCSLHPGGSLSQHHRVPSIQSMIRPQDSHQHPPQYLVPFSAQCLAQKSSTPLQMPGPPHEHSSYPQQQISQEASTPVKGKPQPEPVRELHSLFSGANDDVSATKQSSSSAIEQPSTMATYDPGHMAKEHVLTRAAITDSPENAPDHLARDRYSELPGKCPDRTAHHHDTPKLLVCEDFPGRTACSPSPSSRTSRFAHTSSTSNSPEDEALDTIDEFTDDDSSNYSLGIDTQKEAILDHLMVYFHQIFATAGDSTQRGEHDSTPSRPPRQINESPHAKSAQPKRKRKSGDRDEGDYRDEEDEDVNRKRPRHQDGIVENSLESAKRLACPYFKHKPSRYQSRRSCSGPGWRTVHRLKEHIYREHSLPSHCRRCHKIFESEAQLTEHSRSADTCVVTDTLPPEGFDKDQEKKLKNRSQMFRADSEETKWQIVFIILFPSTAHSELPSPYYDTLTVSAIGSPQDRSPKAPELKQFDAFMRRELPRKVRKALEAAMEKIIGPVEETLKNELESIVRDCHETLTRTFLDTAQAVASSACNLKEAKHTTQQNALIDSRDCETTGGSQQILDGLSLITLPPNSEQEPWTNISNSMEYMKSVPTWSDSGYLSQKTTGNPSYVSDSVWQHEATPTEAAFTVDTSIDFHQLQPWVFDEEQQALAYIGKGKGRATDDRPRTNH